MRFASHPHHLVAYSNITTFGSDDGTSVMISTFRALRYSVMLCRNTCDRVRSCLAHIESTVASIAFGSRNAVEGSDSFNVLLPLVVYDRVYDVILFSCSGREARR